MNLITHLVVRGHKTRNVLRCTLEQVQVVEDVDSRLLEVESVDVKTGSSRIKQASAHVCYNLHPEFLDSVLVVFDCLEPISQRLARVQVVKGYTVLVEVC